MSQDLDLDVGQLAAMLRANVGLLLRRLRQVHGEGELTLPESSALVRLERGGPAMPSALARLEQISPQSMGRPVRLPGRQWAVGGFSEVLAKEVGPPALGDPAKVAQVVLISASPPTGTTLPPPTATPLVPGLADSAS